MLENLTNALNHVGQGESEPERAARPGLALGWLAKGLLYLTIGILGLEIVRRGWSSESADQRGALEAISDAPIGRIAVFVVSSGLILYAIWQVWAAITQDDESEDVSAGRFIHWLKRIGWVGLACTYLLIAVTGIQIALRGESAAQNSSDGTTSPSGISSRLFELPGGTVLVAIIGLVTIAVGVYHAVKGVRREFLDDIVTDDMSPVRRRLLSVLGTVGFIARSMLLGIAGWLFVDAARSHDPDRAGGIDQSLDALARAPGGDVLLAVCSVGIIAAGAYDMLTFRRQRIDEVDE